MHAQPQCEGSRAMCRWRDFLIGLDFEAIDRTKRQPDFPNVQSLVSKENEGCETTARG
jgi:hypothetical protein